MTGVNGMKVYTTTSTTTYNAPGLDGYACLISNSSTIVVQFKLTGETSSEVGLILPANAFIYLWNSSCVLNFVFRAATAGTAQISVQVFTGTPP
ncbi:MAG: hypothetical protein ABL951_04200 [Alphaproteobacteria bacterium]